MFNKMFDFIGHKLATFLTHPVHHYEPISTSAAERLQHTLIPGDVLLVEGNSRISTAIKYLTQSTWSHAALYVGPILGRSEPDGEPHVLVDAELGRGVMSLPLSSHVRSHTRICRPISLSETDLQQVITYAVDRIGNDYDLKNVVDLCRYLLPTPPVPTRFRRRMIALGSGEPTRCICSTLIAQAFESVRYPILPRVEVIDDSISHEAEDMTIDEIHHIRHHSLFTPRDFDISPFFKVVKPTIEAGFDYRQLRWAGG
jgi:hypothetical protein